MNMERRRATRYQFVADAEFRETHSGARAKTKTGDLSLGGCFLDTLNPSPEGTEIQVTIHRAGQQFTASGRVVLAIPALGMGIIFTAIPPVQLQVLEEWIGQLEMTAACPHQNRS